MSAIIGVDPGLSGGIAIIDGEEITLRVMPVLAGELNLAALSDIFREYPKAKVYLEQVHAMPGQGVTSMFTFGKGYGAIMGVLAALRLPYTLVTPQKWQKVLYEGIKATENKKDRSVLAATRLYPLVNLLATERSRTPHLGIVDALMLAEFGRRQK